MLKDDAAPIHPTHKCAGILGRNFIIAQDEQTQLFNAINEARKATVEPKKSDEERLSKTEAELGNALMVCRKIRERFNNQITDSMKAAIDKSVIDNKEALDILSKQ